MYKFQINAILWGKVLGEEYVNIFMWYRWYFSTLNTQLKALCSILQTVWENGSPRPGIFIFLSCSQDTSSSLAVFSIYKIVIARTMQPQSSAEVGMVQWNTTIMNSRINAKKPVIYSTQLTTFLKCIKNVVKAGGVLSVGFPSRRNIRCGFDRCYRARGLWVRAKPLVR